jgi:uncharacterized protein YjdB
MRRFACLTSAALVACTTATDPAPVATITLQPQLDSIEVGEVYNSWVVTLKDGAGVTLTGRTLTWESSSQANAPVNSATGEVTGVGGGSSAVITVRSEGKSAQASIKVLQPILAIVISPDSFDLPMTTTRTIVAQLVGPGGLAITNRVITWSSTDPSIAVVGGNGLVTPVSPGTVTINVRAGTKEKAVRVRVVGEPVSSVRITPQGTVHVIRLGQSRQFTAECLNATQQVLSGRTITWNSGNPIVAAVSTSGLVTGNALGSAQISATCDNSASASFSAQVTQVPVSSVTITPTSLTISVGTQSQLTATARDSAGNVLSLQGRQVQWTSSNIPVAPVSPQGVVSGSSAGSANITVTVDGKASAPVTVDVIPFFELSERPSRPATGASRSDSRLNRRHAR